jgi:hypothetical protein
LRGEVVDPVVHNPAEQFIHPLAWPELAAEGLDLGEGEDKG